MSAGAGIRRRARRHNAEAKWRAYHSRQREIYAALLEEPGACYWNVNIPGCTWDRMAKMGEDCREYRPAKEFESGRPKGGRGGA